MLFEKIQFFFKGLPFVAIFMSYCMRFCLFAT